ncbi:hypothetical protein [Arthrobacter sp. FW306-2-2C-D06B]|uniref:hypothetical protein n=1 Tax=Arthrobacter sp. FW306-2-2C-D06B TaxID=2879618 RepID=UPI001F218903|nr:hypothetical protein [Arthrobacter sp. FW306-2-2C-D06B]UKA57705.1 hypothetical protein LFT47_15630 [Arthrobacter sp. FW306-2-2C-D06B]
MPDQPEYPAPLNSVGAPPPRQTEPLSTVSRVPVIAKLVWPKYLQYVPAMVTRTSEGKVLVQWWPNPFGSGTRMTWLKDTDVRAELRYER